MDNGTTNVYLTQDLLDRGKSLNLSKAVMRKLVEQSLECGNLDYLHHQMERFEAWCKADPRWLNDPRRRDRILRPIANFPAKR